MTWWALAARAEEPWGAVLREPVPEEWSDGLTLRPARSTSASVAGAGVAGGRTSPFFGDVAGQLATGIASGVVLGVGLGGRVLHTPTADGAVTGLQSVTGELWLVTEADHARHGFGFVYGRQTGLARGWYLHHPTEGADRGELVYDLLADLGRVDVSFDVRLGGSDGATGRSSTTIAGVVELDRHAALTLGFQGSFAPMSWVVVGFDLRPVDHLEVTAGVGVPIPRSDVDPGDEVQPGLRAKAWF